MTGYDANAHPATPPPSADNGTPDDEFHLLRLYISGMSPRSQRAIANIRRICAEHLAGRYRLEIVDICQQPELAREGQIVAVPTLVKQLPPPLRKVIGDLSQTDRVLISLDITPSPLSR